MKDGDDMLGAPATIATPVAPTSTARVRLRPLGAGDAVIREGLLADRQRVNREVTLLRGAQELERAGTLDNLRIAAGLATGEHRGMVFSDSDVYKWLEAVAWELRRAEVADLRERAEEAIELVAGAQQPDGYLNTWCQISDPGWRWSDLEMGHELYCAGHLIQAAVAWSRALGDRRLLRVARRFADLIDEVFRGGGQDGTDGHPEIELALVELYRETGETRYLELADELTTRRGRRRFSGPFTPAYYQDDEPVRGSREIRGHAVRAVYLAAGVTDLYAETGDEALLSAALAQWHDMTTRKSYLTGGIGSRHTGEAFGEAYELPSDRAYCETCAAIASVMWSWRLLLVTGESRFADLIERTLYNGLLSGLSLDGTAFFYVNPLQAPPSHPARHAWDPIACCPPNIMRTLATLEHYIATRDEHGLQLHLYTGARLATATLDGRPLALQMTTDYPWSGRIEIEVDSPGEWTLSLRIPEWATSATIDGAPAQAGGYARLHRDWRPGDRVVLELGVVPRVTAPNPRIDAVRGCLAIERGPLVYCVEQADVSAGVELADLRLGADAPLADAPARPGLDGLPAVAAQALIAALDGWDGAAYRPAGEPLEGAGAQAARTVELVAVPYFAWANRGAGAMRVWIPQSG